MPGQTHETTNPRSSHSHHTEPISAETIERCAGLLAGGEIEWPEGLSAKQEAELLEAVRRYRRVGLVKFIASRIAADIAQEARSGKMET